MVNSSTYGAGSTANVSDLNVQIELPRSGQGAKVQPGGPHVGNGQHPTTENTGPSSPLQKGDRDRESVSSNARKSRSPNGLFDRLLTAIKTGVCRLAVMSVYGAVTGAFVGHSMWRLARSIHSKEGEHALKTWMMWRRRPLNTIGARRVEGQQSHTATKICGTLYQALGFNPSFQVDSKSASDWKNQFLQAYNDLAESYKSGRAGSTEDPDPSKLREYAYKNLEMERDGYKNKLFKQTGKERALELLKPGSSFCQAYSECAKLYGQKDAPAAQREDAKKTCHMMHLTLLAMSGNASKVDDRFAELYGKTVSPKS